MDHPQLEVRIYQIVDDTMLKENRTDGTGWEWCWADWQRDWMDATPNRFAYRCLPLTIVNQTGWWIRNPVGFTATWRGHRSRGPSTSGSTLARDLVNGSTASSARGSSPGTRRSCSGPGRRARAPGLRPVELLQGQRPPADRADRERLDQHVVHHELEDHGFPTSRSGSSRRTPLPGDPAGRATSVPTWKRLGHLPEADDNPEIYRAYQEWDEGRRRFHDQKAGARSSRMTGRKTTSRAATPSQGGRRAHDKVKPPQIRFLPQALTGSQAPTPRRIVEPAKRRA